MLHVETDPKTSRRIRMTLKRLNFPSAEKERAWTRAQLETERDIQRGVASQQDVLASMTTNASNPVVTPRADGLQYRQRMDDTLRQAIEQADLPGLVGHYYPDSGAQPGRKEDVFAVWRGDEHASFSLFRGDDGVWLYYDHRTHETGNAFGFLVDICGLSKAEAAARLKTVCVSESLPPSAPLPRRRRGKGQDSSRGRRV